MKNVCLLSIACLLSGVLQLAAQPFAVNDATPVIERWMYPFNAAPCDRPASSVFGTSGDAAGVDTRHGQHLLGWDTGALIATNRGPSRYLLRKCRITLTINRGNLFTYDPTQDDFRTYFETNNPVRLPDADAGRPIELFGAAFRNGFDATNFDQCSPFGSGATGERNAFAVGWSTNGALVDVGNNVGKTNEAYPRFEVAPFAIGRTTNVAPGQLVPPGARIFFDLNLEDAFVLSYLQSGLEAGRLRFAVTSLHENGGQLGSPAYPDFATRFNEVLFDPTRIEIEGTVVRDIDSDGDGLPDDWEQFYFDGLGNSGADDPDDDGVNNLAEFNSGTEPGNASSALRFASVAREPGGRVTLRTTHAASHRYVVEFTEDFQTWIPLQQPPVFELGPGVAVWTDDSAGANGRFYRLRADVL